MKLGPIAEWGLNMSKKTITVNSENFETNKKGIFAVGDICNYPGKLKLILSGFHEVALASVECFKRARPNEKYRFEFTTSSKTIQERLGKLDKARPGWIPEFRLVFNQQSRSDNQHNAANIQFSPTAAGTLR